MKPVNKLDATKAAELLGVSRKHFVDRLSKRHDFPRPFIAVSRRTRFWRVEDLMKWAQTPKRAA